MSFCVRDGDPVFFDCPVRSDQSRRTNWPLDRFPLGVLTRTPSAIGFHGGELRIGEKDKRQIEFGDKLIVRFDTVPAHAENDRVRFGHRVDSVAEPARLFRSTWCIVFRIKPKHDIFSRIVAQRMFLAVAAGQSKSRSFLPFKIRHDYLQN
jgi:hypothetical protein